MNSRNLLKDLWSSLLEPNSRTHKKTVAFLVIFVMPTITILGVVLTIIQTCRKQNVISVVIDRPFYTSRFIEKIPEINDNQDTTNFSTTILTCTIQSRMEDINDDRIPFLTFSKNFTSGEKLSFRLYDIDYGFNERDGFVFMCFIIDDMEIIEKATITTTVFSRVFTEDVTIVAVYTPESEDNPRLDNIYHPINMIGKLQNGEIIRFKNSLNSGRHGEWYRISGLADYNNNTLVGFSVNGIQGEELPSPYEYFDDIPVEYENSIFHINIIKATALVFYYYDEIAALDL